MTLRKPNKNALEAVLTFWPTSRETCCFRQKDGGVLIKGSTKCSLIKDEEENYLLINVHRAELLILLTDSFNLKPHYVKQTSPQATNTRSFGWYDIAFLHSLVIHIHSEQSWVHVSVQPRPSVCCSVLAEWSEHQQQLDFLLLGLWLASVLSVSPVMNANQE